VPSAEHTVTINRPLDDVFAFVADKDNDPRWRPGVAEIARVSGVGGGASYRQVMNGPMGRKIPADFEITRYEVGKRIDFRTTAGRVQPSGRFDFVVPATRRREEVDGADGLSLDAVRGGEPRPVEADPRRRLDAGLITAGTRFPRAQGQSLVGSDPCSGGPPPPIVLKVPRSAATGRPRTRPAVLELRSGRRSFDASPPEDSL